MKMAIRALAATTLLVWIHPAHASFLKHLVGTAAQAASQHAGGGGDEAASDDEPATAEPAQPESSRPAPARRQASMPSEIKRPEGAEAQKKAFLEFSRYACSDCEGGRGFDAWAGQILELKGDHAWEAKVGALDIGGRIEWKGRASDGAVEVTSEDAVEGFRCKQVHYRLTRRSDQAMAERDGLFCFGKPEQYVNGERWVDVY